MRESLSVRTFGGFQMLWNGTVIAGSVKDRDSQYTRLMEILLHYSSEGVTRERLEDVLFGDSKSEDTAHLLRSVIYYTRRKLARQGLPASDFIRYEDGRYYWTAEIPVREDAREFEQMAQAALRTEDPSGAASPDALLEACYSYGGEFLPDQSGILWVIMEDRRYRALFARCAEEAARRLRAVGDYGRLEELAGYAIEVWDHAIRRCSKERSSWYRS